MMKVSFGTDGWRGLIADDFNFENVRLVSQSIAIYVNKIFKSKTANRQIPLIIVGYDTRFLSERFAQLISEVLAGNNISVLLTSCVTSTPIVSYGVKYLQTDGAVIVTASHNPPQFNGIKFKASYAGSASQNITKEIEGLIGSPPKVINFEQAKENDLIKEIDLTGFYLEHIRTIVDIEAIARQKFKIVADPMFGTAGDLFDRILSDKGCQVTTIHNKKDPYFGGLNPEPLGYHLKDLSKAIIETKADIGIANDGDADRLGIMDAQGNFVTPHQIFSLLLLHLHKNRGWSGDVIKTISTTSLIDKITNKLKMKFYETPVGFKHICELMLEKDILIGGEESGGVGIKNHIPERDGIVAGLLILEMMAVEQKSLNELIEDMWKEFGEFYYQRKDCFLDCSNGKRTMELLIKDPPSKINGTALAEIKNYDGVKLILIDGSWILFRLSGTEPVLRIYVEASSPQKVTDILNAGEKIFFERSCEI